MSREAGRVRLDVVAEAGPAPHRTDEGLLAPRGHHTRPPAAPARTRQSAARPRAWRHSTLSEALAAARAPRDVSRVARVAAAMRSLSRRTWLLQPDSVQ